MDGAASFRSGTETPALITPGLSVVALLTFITCGGNSCLPEHSPIPSQPRPCRGDHVFAGRSSILAIREVVRGNQPVPDSVLTVFLGLQRYLVKSLAESVRRGDDSMSSVTLAILTKSFNSHRRAPGPASLEIGDGEFMVLVGPSGCASQPSCA